MNTWKFKTPLFLQQFFLNFKCFIAIITANDFLAIGVDLHFNSNKEQLYCEEIKGNMNLMNKLYIIITGTGGG